MGTLWLTLIVILWGFILLEGLLLFGVLRQLGVLYGRLDAFDSLSGTNRPIEQGLELGTQAPDFTLARVGGGQVTLQSHRGQPVLLTFVHPGCGACEKLLPHLNALLSRPELVSLQVLLVTQGSMSHNEQYRDQHGLRPDLLLQTRREVFDAFQVKSTPFVFGVDSDGVIVHKGVANTGTQLERLLPPVSGYIDRLVRQGFIVGNNRAAETSRGFSVPEGRRPNLDHV